MSTMMAENIEQLEMLRTPLRTPLRMKNQDFTPANGKLNSRYNRSNMFLTPTKRSMPVATPRSILGNKNNNIVTQTPNTFKKPRLSPSIKVTLKNKSPRFKFCQNSTPSKFSVYEDTEDALLREMKQKNFKIEAPEKCPWATQEPEFVIPNPPVELIDDFVPSEKSRKKMKLLHLEPLPQRDSELKTTCESLPELPDMSDISVEEPELCPWANFSEDPHYEDSLPLVELENSALSELSYTKEQLSEISIRCLDESIRTLEEELSDQELPDIPSTPELDQELAQLLELSFDSWNL